jgi:acetyltransferase-like isoleucine patch superfamily enzyme
MTSSIAATAIIHPGVRLGDDCRVEDFVIVGSPAAGAEPGEVGVAIGKGATIRSHTVIYAGNVIGTGFQAGHGVLVRESNDIGDDVSIGSHTVVEHHVRIGRGARIHSNAFIPEFSVIEDGAWVGPCVVFTNALYPRSPGAKDDLRGPRVLAGAKIGANATLLPGVVIGRDALVGAGSVVVRDIPDGAVVVGNPARIVRQVSDLDAYRITEET